MEADVTVSLVYFLPEELKEIIHIKNDTYSCRVIFYWFIYCKMSFEKYIVVD